MEDAARVKLLCLDVDGVLTDGSIVIDDHGIESKRFHVRDGFALSVWQRFGYHAAIITARQGMAVRHRARELRIRHVFQGKRNKRDVVAALLREFELSSDEAAYMGDDLPDLPAMRLVGYPMSVADGAKEVREAARFVTVRPGGHGAVREAIEHLLAARDQWDSVAAMDE